MKIIFALIFLAFAVINANSQNQFLMQRQQSPQPMLIPVRQLAEHFNGPALAEALLKYWGLPPSRLGIMTEDGFQRFLAQDEFMSAESNGGTSPDDWIKSVNHIISSYNLNNQRLFSRIELAAGYSNIEEFYQVVTRSLALNVPVVVAFVAQSEEDSVALFTPRYSFILITAVVGSGESTFYTYIDASDGTLRQFDNNFLSFLTTGDINRSGATPSYVIAHLDPQDPIFLNSIGVNREMQSSGKCNFFSTLTSICQNLDRSKRSSYRQTTCLAVDSLNPLTNYADYIYVMQRLIGRNGIQVKISRPTAMTLERFYMENDRESFLKYAEAMLLRIVQKGTVLDSDRSHAARVLFDGMPYIHERILKLLRDDDLRPIFIQTYRAYNFHETIKSIGVDNTVYINDLPKL